MKKAITATMFAAIAATSCQNDIQNKSLKLSINVGDNLNSAIYKMEACGAKQNKTVVISTSYDTMPNSGFIPFELSNGQILDIYYKCTRIGPVAFPNGQIPDTITMPYVDAIVLHDKFTGQLIHLKEYVPK